jgi:large subunit ribosomal protein L10
MVSPATSHRKVDLRADTAIRHLRVPADRPDADDPFGLDARRAERAVGPSEDAMPLNLAQKKELVAELAEVASKAHSLVAAEYAGLSVEQLTALRKQARTSGVFLKVAKNTLVRRAVNGTEYECTQAQLTGPLLYAFSTEDPGAAGRLVKDFIKDKANEALKPKLVAVGGKAYPASHVDVLASLPTRDQALSMLLSVLVQPATMLVRVLAEPATQVTRAINAVGQQKQAA